MKAFASRAFVVVLAWVGLLVFSNPAQAAGPRLLLVVRDQGGTATAATGQVEAALGAKLAAAGYTLVDGAQLDQVKDQAVAASALRGDAGALAQVALSFKADLIVNVRVSSDEGSTPSVGLFGFTVSTKTYRASLSARAVAADAGDR